MNEFRNLRPSEKHLINDDQDLLQFIAETFGKTTFRWIPGKRDLHIKGFMAVIDDTGDDIGYMVICPECGAANVYLWDHQYTGGHCTNCWYKED